MKEAEIASMTEELRALRSQLNRAQAQLAAQPAGPAASVTAPTAVASADSHSGDIVGPPGDDAVGPPVATPRAAHVDRNAPRSADDDTDVDASLSQHAAQHADRTDRSDAAPSALQNEVEQLRRRVAELEQAAQSSSAVAPAASPTAFSILKSSRAVDAAPAALQSSADPHGADQSTGPMPSPAVPPYNYATPLPVARSAALGARHRQAASSDSANSAGARMLGTVSSIGGDNLDSALRPVSSAVSHNSISSSSPAVGSASSMALRASSAATGASPRRAGLRNRARVSALTLSPPSSAVVGGQGPGGIPLSPLSPLVSPPLSPPGSPLLNQSMGRSSFAPAYLPLLNALYGYTPSADFASMLSPLPTVVAELETSAVSTGDTLEARPARLSYLPNDTLIGANMAAGRAGAAAAPVVDELEGVPAAASNRYGGVHVSAQGDADDSSEGDASGIDSDLMDQSSVSSDELELKRPARRSQLTGILMRHR